MSKSVATYLAVNERNRNLARQHKMQPLVLFSLYTAIQIEALEWSAKMALELSQCVNSDERVIEGHKMMEYYYCFWHWTLGAYEVLRTMNQHREHCFLLECANQIQAAKRKLENVRIPMAKQERPNFSGPIHAELSIAGWEDGDLTFDFSGAQIRPKKLMAEIMTVFRDIGYDDIIAEIPVARPAEPPRS